MNPTIQNKSDPANFWTCRTKIEQSAKTWSTRPKYWLAGQQNLHMAKNLACRPKKCPSRPICVTTGKKRVLRPNCFKTHSRTHFPIHPCLKNVSPTSETLSLSRFLPPFILLQTLVVLHSTSAIVSITLHRLKSETTEFRDCLFDSTWFGCSFYDSHEYRQIFTTSFVFAVVLHCSLRLWSWFSTIRTDFWWFHNDKVISQKPGLITYQFGQLSRIYSWFAFKSLISSWILSNYLLFRYKFYTTLNARSISHELDNFLRIWHRLLTMSSYASLIEINLDHECQFDLDIWVAFPWFSTNSLNSALNSHCCELLSFTYIAPSLTLFEIKSLEISSICHWFCIFLLKFYRFFLDFSYFAMSS